MQFHPIQIPGLAQRPGWWKVRPAEIVERAASVRRGRSETIAVTPGNYPVYAVFYGDFDDAELRNNWSAASSSGRPETYCRPPGWKPTVLFLAGIHGAEAESVAAAMNLIETLENKVDFRGDKHEKLVALLENYRLIIVPCANMDGRALSPDHLKGASYHDFRVASQGAWADGRLVDWCGSKEHFPLPLDRVQYPGGYPNSEGFNIMHDACPGHIRTAEAQGILRLVERYAVDFVLNGHSCEHEPVLLSPQEFNYRAHQERALRAYAAVNRALVESGLRTRPPTEPPPLDPGVNLNTVMTLASGALAMTLECCVSLHFSFEELMAPNFIALETLLESGLNDPFVDRTRWRH